MIQSTYVTFKQAVALKEKGFNEELNTVYNIKGEPAKSHYNTMKNSDIEHGTICTRPEQWMVIEWLLITYGIILLPIYDVTSGHFGYNIVTKETLNYTDPKHAGWNTRQEAYSAAFDYILTNLI